MRILLSDLAAARHGDRIRAAAPEAALLPVPPEDPPPDAAGVEIAFLTRDLFLGGTRHRPTAHFVRFLDLLASAPDLRWVQTFSAGTDMAPYGAMLARGLLLTNSAGASAPAVAQTAVAGLMALARQFPRAAEAQRRRAWEPLYAASEPRDVDGQAALASAPARSGRRSAGSAAPSACVRRACGATPRQESRPASTRWPASPPCRGCCRAPTGWSSPVR